MKKTNALREGVWIRLGIRVLRRGFPIKNPSGKEGLLGICQNQIKIR